MSTTDSTLKAAVKEKYGQAALRVAEGGAAECCGSSACCGATTEAWDPITADLYDAKQKEGIPAAALLASLGCGNPTALATLNEGETVLDLGSGGGIVVRGDVPPAVRRNMELWVGCVAGALEEQEFLGLLREAGFMEPSIEPTRIYKAEDAAAFLIGSGLDEHEFASEIDGKFMGAFV